MKTQLCCHSAKAAIDTVSELICHSYKIHVLKTDVRY